MRVLPTVSLTANQKRVLAKIAAAPTPKVAGEEISGDQNLAGARDQLAHLGAIEFVAGEASMTDKGQQLARDSNVVDDSGQLTPDGEQLAYTDAAGKQDKDATKAPPTTAPAGVPPMGLGAPPLGAAPPAPGGGGMQLDLTMSYVPASFKEFLAEEHIARISRGKAYNSEFAPIVYRFQHVPFDMRHIFHRITQRYKGARDAKKRFYWNSDYRFWYTESSESMQEARDELERAGVQFETMGIALASR
jgi:hypothetical protein